MVRAVLTTLLFASAVAVSVGIPQVPVAGGNAQQPQGLPTTNPTLGTPPFIQPPSVAFLESNPSSRPITTARPSSPSPWAPSLSPTFQTQAPSVPINSPNRFTVPFNGAYIPTSSTLPESIDTLPLSNIPVSPRFSPSVNANPSLLPSGVPASTRPSSINPSPVSENIPRTLPPSGTPAGTIDNVPRFRNPLAEVPYSGSTIPRERGPVTEEVAPPPRMNTPASQTGWSVPHTNYDTPAYAPSNPYGQNSAAPANVPPSGSIPNAVDAATADGDTDGEWGTAPLSPAETVAVVPSVSLYANTNANSTINGTGFVPSLNNAMNMTPSSAVKGITNATAGVLGEIKNSTQNVVNNIISGTSAAANTTADVVGGLKNSTMGAFNRTVSSVANATQNAWGSVVNSTEGALNSTVGALKNATGAAANVTQGAWNATTGALSNATGSAINMTQGGWNAATGAFENATGAARNMTQGAWNATAGAVGSAAGGIWNATQGALNSTIGTLSNLTGSAMNATQGAWNSTVGAVSGAAGTISNMTQGALNSTIGALNSTLGTVKNATGAATNATQGAWNATTGALANLTGSAVNMTQGAWNATTGAVSNATASAANATKGAVNSTIDAVKNATGSAWNSTVGALSNASGAAINSTQAAVNATTGAWNATQSAWNTSTNGTSGLWNATQGSVNNTLNTTQGAWNATGNVTQGLWNATGMMNSTHNNSTQQLLNSTMSMWNHPSRSMSDQSGDQLGGTSVPDVVEGIDVQVSSTQDADGPDARKSATVFTQGSNSTTETMKSSQEEVEAPWEDAENFTQDGSWYSYENRSQWKAGNTTVTAKDGDRDDMQLPAISSSPLAYVNRIVEPTDLASLDDTTVVLRGNLFREVPDDFRAKLKVAQVDSSTVGSRNVRVTGAFGILTISQSGAFYYTLVPSAIRARENGYVIEDFFVGVEAEGYSGLQAMYVVIDVQDFLGHL